MKLYQAPYETRDKRTLLAFYEDWKEASQTVRSNDQELSKQIERNLINKDRYTFISMTFGLDEAEKLRG